MLQVKLSIILNFEKQNNQSNETKINRIIISEVKSHF